jgi:hypothetical protein
LRVVLSSGDPEAPGGQSKVDRQSAVKFACMLVPMLPVSKRELHQRGRKRLENNRAELAAPSTTVVAMRLASTPETRNPAIKRFPGLSRIAYCSCRTVTRAAAPMATP